MIIRHAILVVAVGFALTAPARAEAPSEVAIDTPRPGRPSGEPRPAPTDPDPDTAEPAEPDWDKAPPPDQASGIVRRKTPTGNYLRWVPRAVLFVPRWGFWLAMQPLRLTAWAYERYHVAGRLRKSVFNVDRPIAIFPTAKFDTDVGAEVGIRFVHRDLFGKGERLRLRADFGGEFNQGYGFQIKSGERFGEHVRIALDARWERKPRERFYGIGNADETEQPEMLIDPSGETAAVETRFREDLVRSVLTLETPIYGQWKTRLSGALMVREFGGADHESRPNVEDVYDTSRLTGWDAGVKNLYIEGELEYDSRKPVSMYQTKAIDATGWLASVHLGGMRGLDGDPSDFYRYGGEVQRYIDLYQGSRVLALRVLVESVGGTDGSDGKIAFVDLPKLGGHDFLRGYPRDRFRDRAITLGTAEYTWDLGNFIAAFTFVDVGRPFPSLRDFTFEDMRVGFGGGIQLHTQKSYLLRTHVAASKDGDVFFYVSFSPAFGRRERAGRY